VRDQLHPSVEWKVRNTKNVFAGLVKHAAKLTDGERDNRYFIEYLVHYSICDHKERAKQRFKFLLCHFNGLIFSSIFIILFFFFFLNVGALFRYCSSMLG